MQISSRFTVAVHTLLVIHTFKDQKTTSDFIAASVQVNPVIIRRTLLSLKAAGMVEVRAGSGGANIVRDLSDITLYDVYRAVECVDGDRWAEHPRRARLPPCRRAARDGERAQKGHAPRYHAGIADQAELTHEKTAERAVFFIKIFSEKN